MRTRFKLRRKTDKKLFAVENNFQNQKCSRIRNCLRFKIVLLSLKTIQDDFLLRMRQSNDVAKKKILQDLLSQCIIHLYKKP